MTAPLADRIRAVLALAEKFTAGRVNNMEIIRRWQDGEYVTIDGTLDDILAANEIHTMAALLRECLADDGWRPIEEAPRDGSVFWSCTTGDSRGRETYWNEAAGWVCYPTGTRISPTHFRPLPAALGAEL